jgi:hypothetical protein
MMVIEKTCTASQMVERLQRLIEKYGDLSVYARDADTGWLLPVGLTFSDAQPVLFSDAQPYLHRIARFEVCTEYYGRPHADF